jgi:hypothetical protein
MPFLISMLHFSSSFVQYDYLGNIYYALTHAPEPLTEEYAYALSWKAAMERFEAAGSISVAEAEAMSDAVASAETSIEVCVRCKFRHYCLSHRYSLYVTCSI